MSVSAYLSRIGLDRAPAPSPDGLAAIQSAHRTTIGFENLDIRLGRQIAIDSPTVFDKLVRRGRGGYCFEQNRLFADMLALMGFSNRPLLARVRLGPQAGDPPRTHVLLLVDFTTECWIADAGFGGSFVPPMPLREDFETRTADGARHRLSRLAGGGEVRGEWLLERAGPPQATDGRVADHADWQPQYSFSLAEVAPADLEMCNHWTATRAATRFTELHVVSIALPGGFASMVDRQLTVHASDRRELREIADAADYARTLKDVFRIALSEEAVARLPLFAEAVSVP